MSLLVSAGPHAREVQRAASRYVWRRRGVQSTGKYCDKSVCKRLQAIQPETIPLAVCFFTTVASATEGGVDWRQQPHEPPTAFINLSTILLTMSDPPFTAPDSVDFNHLPARHKLYSKAPGSSSHTILLGVSLFPTPRWALAGRMALCWICCIRATGHDVWRGARRTSASPPTKPPGHSTFYGDAAW